MSAVTATDPMLDLQAIAWCRERVQKSSIYRQQNYFKEKQRLEEPNRIPTSAHISNVGDRKMTQVNKT